MQIGARSFLRNSLTSFNCAQSEMGIGLLFRASTPQENTGFGLRVEQNAVLVNGKKRNKLTLEFCHYYFFL